MRHALTLTAALSLLTACESATTPWPIPPANMAQPCPQVPGRQPKDLGELLAADVELIGLYRECAARHQALAEWAALP